MALSVPYPSALSRRSSAIEMGLAEQYDSAGTAAALADFYALKSDLDTDPYLARKAASTSSRRELADAYGKIRFALENASKCSTGAADMAYSVGSHAVIWATMSDCGAAMCACRNSMRIFMPLRACTILR